MHVLKLRSPLRSHARRRSGGTGDRDRDGEKTQEEDREQRLAIHCLVDKLKGRFFCSFQHSSASSSRVKSNQEASLFAPSKLSRVIAVSVPVAASNLQLDIHQLPIKRQTHTTRCCNREEEEGRETPDDDNIRERFAINLICIRRSSSRAVAASSPPKHDLFLAARRIEIASLNDHLSTSSAAAAARDGAEHRNFIITEPPTDKHSPGKC